MGGNIGKGTSPKNIEELTSDSKYTTEEVKRWSQSFSKQYPQGYISPHDFKKIYGDTFPQGDASKHFFIENNLYSTS